MATSSGENIDQRHRFSFLEYYLFIFFEVGFPLLPNSHFLKRRNHDDSERLFNVTEIAINFRNWFLSDFEELILPRFSKTKVSKVAAFTLTEIAHGTCTKVSFAVAFL